MGQGSKPLVVATGNPGKLGEMQRYLTDVLGTNVLGNDGLADGGLADDGLDVAGGSGWVLQLKPAELDIEETGVTFSENARLKASQVALATGEWAIADDSGLSVTALGGAPGVYSARYGHDDRDRIERVLRELAERELAGQSDRSAAFVCVVAIARPDGSIALECEGICPGEIAREPVGEGGFGYDPIFYVPELGCTYAQMTPEQKKQISHRGRAFAQLIPQLTKLQDV